MSARKNRALRVSNRLLLVAGLIVMAAPFAQSAPSACSKLLVRPAGTTLQDMSVLPVLKQQLTSIDHIRPTQMSVGMTHADLKEVAILANPNLADSIQSRPIPGVIAPDGTTWISDGHHWSTASKRIVDKRMKTDPKSVADMKLLVDVVGDFTGKSWQDFISYLHKNNIGYFTPEVRALFERVGADGKRFIPEDKLVELYQTYLPKNLSVIADSPARSALGLAIEDKLDIKAEKTLINYIEFYLDEELETVFKARGLNFAKMKNSSEVTPQIVNLTAEILATDAKALDLILEKDLRPGVDPIAASKLNRDAINNYRTKVLGLNKI